MAGGADPASAGAGAREGETLRDERAEMHSGGAGGCMDSELKKDFVSEHI